MRHLKSFLGVGTALAALVIAFSVSATAGFAQETITIDAHAQTTPFPHFWEQMFGSGHAILSLRAGYRDDMRAVKHVTEFRYVRFHGILNHEVYAEKAGFQSRRSACLLVQAERIAAKELRTMGRPGQALCAASDRSLRDR
jgi:hypothetical protein